MPELLAALDVFIQEHRRCGEVGRRVEGWRAWMAGDCGASMLRLLLGAVTAVIITLTGCSKTSWIIPPGRSEQQPRRDYYERQWVPPCWLRRPRLASPPSTGFVNPSEGYISLRGTLG